MDNPYLDLTSREVCEINDALALDGIWSEPVDELLWDALFANTTEEQWAELAKRVRGKKKPGAFEHC